MNILNDTLKSHISSVCEQHQLIPLVAIADVQIIRKYPKVIGRKEVIVYFIPAEIPVQHLLEMGMMLPLSNGPFDKLLQDYSFINKDLIKPQDVDMTHDGEEIEYSIAYIPIHYLIRYISKGVITPTAALTSNGHVYFGAAGHQITLMMHDFIVNASAKLICDNVAAEFMLTVNKYATEQTVDFKQLMDTAYAHAYFLAMKRAGFDIAKTIIHGNDLMRDITDSPFYQLAVVIADDFPEFTENKSIKLDTRRHHTTVVPYLNTAVKWIQEEQSKLSFPEKDIPVEKFFRNAHKFLMSYVKTT